jgi:hypothetical protein
MSNAISKQRTPSKSQSKQDANRSDYDYVDDYDEYDYDYEDDYSDKTPPIFTNDTLVLCFEEVDCDTKNIDMVCYVLYDQTEREYYICGKRQDATNNKKKTIAVYNDFKFYCKSSKHVIKMLKSIMDTENNGVNHVMYNYKDIYYDDDCVEHEYLDYNTLYESQDDQKEICAYDGIEFKKSYVKDLLTTLKHVRY